MPGSWKKVLGTSAVAGHFTAREANVLQGRRVQIVREYFGLKPGLNGQVSEARRTPSGWLLDIGWDNGTHDSLTKRECMEHLEVRA